MDSLILKTGARVLFVPLLLLALFTLYRGHNLPGGGFIGGLLAASAFVLIGLAEGSSVARRILRVGPETLMAIGVLVAALSALPAWLVGETIFTGLWLPTFQLPLLGTVHLGTPLIFDIGVFLAVIGFTLTVIFSLDADGGEGSCNS